MKIARKVVTMLALAALLCTLLATAAFAAENGSLWVTVEQKEGTAALIVTDTVVTDGVVKVTYDSEVLTYESTVVAEGYVAMYAVNAEEAGIVLISWVAPGAYELEDGAACLIQVNFSGVEENSTITLTGSAHDASGSELDFADAPDTSKLEDAIADAEALDEQKYTEESYGAMEETLADAKAVLADATATQAEVDAAEKALRDAIAALEKISGSTGTEGTEDPSESSTTKATEDSGSNSNTGDESHVWLFMATGMLSVAAIFVLLIKMKFWKGGNAE